GLGPDRGPTFHLLDDHRLGAAMAEALAHNPLLNAAPFQAQRFAGRDAQLLFAGFFSRFSHSDLNPIAGSRILMRRRRYGPRRHRAPFRRKTPGCRTALQPVRFGTARGAPPAPQTCPFPPRPSALHGSHLTDPVPNPIALT